MEMKIRDFVTSEEFDRMIGSSNSKYKEKMLKIVDKSGVGSRQLTDEAAVKKLMQGSWNWYGFFFSAGWGAYVQVRYLWLMIIILLAFEFVVGAGAAIGAMWAVMFGMFGNGLYLQRIILNYNAGKKEKMPTSILNLCILILVIVGYESGMLYFYPDQGYNTF